MYCKNCGQEIDDKAVICVHCGVATSNMMEADHAQSAQDKKINVFGLIGFVISILSVVLGFYFCVAPVVGLILSIIGVVKAKKFNSFNELAVVGVIISAIAFIGWLLIWIIATIILGSFVKILEAFLIVIFSGF